jgi:hypothetical protein
MDGYEKRRNGGNGSVSALRPASDLTKTCGFLLNVLRVLFVHWEEHGRSVSNSF